MRNVMSWIKVIFFNIFTTFSLLGALLLTPPLVYYVYSFTSSNGVESSSTDIRANLDLYSDFAWADKSFFEFSNLNTTYYDYITWRRDDFVGETVNISNGLRVTTAPQNRNSNISDYYFFGGSTTWGTGVNDANTYPSIFAQRFETQAINFGESGYIARQSLAFLNNFLVENSMSDLSERHVVFYDGVNDVAGRCRSEINGLGTLREHQIQNSLSSQKGNEKYSFGKVFEQLTQFLQAVTRRLGENDASLVAESTYSCSSDSKRAEDIARTLVETWQLASDTVVQRGGSFTAILQPVAFIGNPNVDYLELTNSNDLALKMQFESVYPLVRKFAEAANINFIDLSSVYDSCENCYIDFCHVGPQAHQILVESLVNKLGR
jgi:hypothetical protein